MVTLRPSRILICPLKETTLRAGRNAELRFSHPKNPSSAADASTLVQDFRPSAGIEGSQPIPTSMLPPRLVCQASQLYTQNTNEVRQFCHWQMVKVRPHVRMGIDSGGSKA